VCSSPAVAEGPRGRESPRRLSIAELEERIRGGWAGKMIGVAYGAALKATRHSARHALAAARASVALVGRKGTDGGRADPYVDGVKAGELKTYVSERTTDDWLWQAFGLAPQAHTLRVVTREDVDARSQGRGLDLVGRHLRQSLRIERWTETGRPAS
jgi:hypothetical protein